MSYRLLIDIEVVARIQLQPSRLRRGLPEHFRAIEKHPLARSDYADSDEQGRRVEVSAAAGFVIYYWIDEADRQVKILRLIGSDESTRLIG